MDGRESRAAEPISPEKHTTASRVALTVFAASAGFFLWTEHRAHVIEYLPWAIFLLCPLMHLFMHRGHGMHAPEEHAAHPQRRSDR